MSTATDIAISPQAQLANPIWDKIMSIQKNMLHGPHAREIIENMPKVTHHFGPKVYVREILMEAGRHKLVIGAMHKTEHFNIVLTGRASVLMDPETDDWADICAPSIFISKPFVKKVLIIHEDMRWLTIHPLEEDATEADIERLEEMLSVEPPRKAHRDALANLEIKELQKRRGLL